MQAMLMIHNNDAEWAAMPAQEQASVMAAYGAYIDALRAAGVMRGGERLKPAAGAHTIRVRDGIPQVLDGPYAETKEQLGGFVLIEVADMQEALRWAARCPGAALGAVEVREVWLAAEMAASRA